MTQPIISIRNLTKNFGAKQVLCGIDLDVHRGEVLGYLGPNGAGKSTTVKIMIGMVEEFAGEVTVCGHDVRRDGLTVKRLIGYVPEAAALYEALTPREYLRFIGRIYGMTDAEIDRRIQDMLGLLGLASEIDNRMTTFSKGMKQKVLIAAGLIHNPEVVFLDEPLSGLDANTVVIVKEIIRQLAHSGKTVFYCSHVMDVVERVCDRIVIINGGKIIADGTFEQLQAASHEAASLEHIFTQLTSAGGHEAVASRFVQAITGSAPTARPVAATGAPGAAAPTGDANSKPPVSSRDAAS